MGTLFQTVNEGVSNPGIVRRRVWVEPGYLTVLWPGLVANLTINRVDDRYEPQLSASACKQKPGADEYKFWLLVKALRLNEQRNPVAVLVEVGTDQRVNAPGMRA